MQADIRPVSNLCVYVNVYVCMCDRRCFTTVKKRTTTTTTGVQQRQEQKKKEEKDNKQNWQYQTYKKYVHQPREREREK